MTEKLPTLVGTWLQIGHPIVAEIAAYKNFDWICVDLEHSPTTLETMASMFRAIAAANPDIILTVRVPDHDPKTIGRCLDAGAQCLIVPKVDTYAQAAKIVEAAYYPPLGKRGCGYSRSNRYGSQSMDNICKIIVQIEHHKTIDCDLRLIIKHPLIDGAFIGPLDLAGSLPNKKNRAVRMTTLTAKFKAIISEADPPKYMGIHIVEPSPIEVARVMRAGYNFVALGVDTSLLSESMNNLFTREDRDAT